MFLGITLVYKLICGVILFDMESKEPKKKKRTTSSDIKKEKKVTKVAVSKVHETVENVTHHIHSKKRIPSHITATSIFASEFRKKIPSPILTSVSVFVLFLLIFLYKGTRLTEVTKNQTGATKVKTEYLNTVYGFSFKLPHNYSQVRESPEQKKCLNNRTWDGASLLSVTVAEIQNISVIVGCQKLSGSIVHQFSDEAVSSREVIVYGRKAHLHEFVTKNGYSWQVVQVPLDENHYLEISHNYKPEPEFVAPDELAGYKPLSENEWNSLVTSLAFK